MASKNANSLSTERVPHIARPIIVATKKDAAGDGEGNGGDAAQDVVMGEDIELAVRPNVEQAAGGIIGPGREGIAVGEEPGECISVCGISRSFDQKSRLTKQH